MINTYYIYQHRRADTGEVFYIGKGTRSDAKGYQRAAELKRRSKFWDHVAGKTTVIVEVMADFFDERDAFLFEARLIASFGRRDIGTGCLVNMTNGGEGMSGHTPSEATKAKRVASMTGRSLPAHVKERISASMSGERHPLFGKKRSDETRNRQSQSGKGLRLGGKSPQAKAVVDRSTGRVFPSTRDAAEYCGLKMRYLAAQLAGERRNKTTLEYL